jgi:type IV pilus assembly protein PilO
MALPAFFDPIVNAARWQKLVLAAMGLALIVGGLYYLVLSPLEIRVGTLQAQASAVQKELLAARATAADLTRMRREIAELERTLDVMKERLPTEKEMPALFRKLTDAAFQVGLGVSLFQPREGRVRDFFVEYPITLTAEGGYHQLGEFFERVASLPRVVTVSELKMSGLANSKSSLRADVTLATYTYRPVGSPPAPKQPGGN